MDCSLTGSSVHGILQARILERVAISFSRGSSQPRGRTWVSAFQADTLPSEPPGKPGKTCIELAKHQIKDRRFLCGRVLVNKVSKEHLDEVHEALVLWPPDMKSQLTGKDWGQEEKGTREDEMVGWHHWLNGHEFEQTQGYSEGQGSLLLLLLLLLLLSRFSHVRLCATPETAAH